MPAISSFSCVSLCSMSEFPCKCLCYEYDLRERLSAKQGSTSHDMEIYHHNGAYHQLILF